MRNNMRIELGKQFQETIRLGKKHFTQTFSGFKTLEVVILKKSSNRERDGENTKNTRTHL